MNMPLFVTLFFIDGHLGCFQVSDVMSKAAMNILVQLFMWPHALTYLECVRDIHI